MSGKRKYGTETAVGAFVFAGLICVGYLTIKLGNLDWFNQEETYQLTARFSSAQGLIKGGKVNIAGVQVGSIDDIRLDPEEYVALVDISLPRSIQLNDDAIASIRTSGLIGDRFISLAPGGSGILLEPGEMIIETESAVDLESLISKVAFGGVDK